MGRNESDWSIFCDWFTGPGTVEGKIAEISEFVTAQEFWREMNAKFIFLSE